MLGEHKEALAAHEQALKLRTRLALADPSDARAQDDASESHLQVAQALTNLGRIRDAVAEVALATEGWRDLVQRDPSNVRLRASLANGLAAMGRCDALIGRRGSALSRIAEARAIRMQLAADSPQVSMNQAAIAELDSMDAAVRAGQVPSGKLAAGSAWLD
jgi:tetratricopeptide (TPR) repeat protein